MPNRPRAQSPAAQQYTHLKGRQAQGYMQHIWSLRGAHCGVIDGHQDCALRHNARLCHVSLKAIDVRGVLEAAQQVGAWRS